MDALFLFFVRYNTFLNFTEFYRILQNFTEYIVQNI